MSPTAPAPRRRRFLIYLPVLVLAVLAVGWSAFWFTARARAERELDAALAREAQAGRNWTCADRRIEGFPFRVELRCSNLALVSTRWGAPVRVTTGPVLVLGQVYTPGRVLAQVGAPIAAELPGGRRLDLGFSQLEASFRHTLGRPERISVVMTQPQATVTAPGLAVESWKAAELELHLRPDPDRPAEEQAVDIALTARGGSLPPLDQLLGDTQPADLAVEATVTRSGAFLRGFNPDALEAWRTGGGEVAISRLATRKGNARLQASGRLMLDDTHRPAGQVDASIAGIERIGGIRVGGLAAGLGSLLGGSRPSASPPADPSLTPIPTLVLREGRLHLGPIRLPLPALAPLY